MSNVEIDPDCIITAFEKFKNAHKDDDISYQSLAERLYNQLEGAEEE
jgi:hypothetical protein